MSEPFGCSSRRYLSGDVENFIELGGIGAAGGRRGRWWRRFRGRVRVAEDDVHQAILHQRHEHEHRANRHESVHSLQIRNRWQGRLTLGVLRGEGQQGSYAERDSGWRRFRFYPEGDPLRTEVMLQFRRKRFLFSITFRSHTHRHDYDQAGWNVGVKQVVAEPTFQDEHYFEAGEVT